MLRRNKCNDIELSNNDHRCVAYVPGSGVLVDILSDDATDMKVEGAAGGPVQQVGGLCQLWSQGVEVHFTALGNEVESLRQCRVLLPDGKVQSMLADSLFYVPIQHLHNTDHPSLPSFSIQLCAESIQQTSRVTLRQLELLHLIATQCRYTISLFNHQEDDCSFNRISFQRMFFNINHFETMSVAFKPFLK